MAVTFRVRSRVAFYVRWERGWPPFADHLHTPRAGSRVFVEKGEVMDGDHPVAQGNPDYFDSLRCVVCLERERADGNVVCSVCA